MSGRLLAVTPADGRGGSEAYLLHVTTEAIRRGWTATVALPMTAETVEVMRAATAVGADVVPLELALGTSSKRETATAIFNDLRRGAGVLLRRRPDVVLLVLPWPLRGLGVMLASVLLRVPYVATFQLVSDSLTVSPALRLIYRLATHGPHRWITVSDANGALLNRAFGPIGAATVRIYNGVSAPPVPSRAQVEDIRSSLRDELAVPRDTVIMLTIGRLTIQKGHRHILASSQEILRRHPSAVFVWAGTGPEEQSLRESIRALGLNERVRLLGRRDDIDRLLTAADVFLFPSDYEGYPFALMEAMVRGVPVVSSDLGPMAEAVEDDVTGFLFRPGDDRALVHAVDRALTNRSLAREVGRRGRHVVHEQFSLNRMFSETFALFHELMGVPPEVSCATCEA